MDQLLKYEFERIFPGCRLLDIHEYLMEKGVKLEGVKGVQYLYHDPCHTPMKTHNPTKVASTLLGKPVLLSDRCCGESGTLAVTRPDVSTQVRFSKQLEIEKGIAQLKVGAGETAKILTSCPSCLQGLSRYRNDFGDAPLEADYIVVELARNILGQDWLDRYVNAANTGGIERVLL
jgi:Fe-S oxidoreductase